MSRTAGSTTRYEVFSALSAGAAKNSTPGRTRIPEEGSDRAGTLASLDPSNHCLHPSRHLSVKLYACDSLYLKFCGSGFSLRSPFDFVSPHCVFGPHFPNS